MRRRRRQPPVEPALAAPPAPTAVSTVVPRGGWVLPWPRLLALVALWTLLVYGRAWWAELAFDDHLAITKNADVVGAPLWDSALWRHDFWGQDIARGDSHMVRRRRRRSLSSPAYTDIH